MRKLILAIFILILYSCVDKVIEEIPIHSIYYNDARFIDETRIDFNISYNIPSEYFKEDNFYIISWNKIGSKGTWNGFLTDTLILKSGNIELINDLSKIKPVPTTNDTVMFHFSLERKLSFRKTIQITRTQVIYFYPN